MNNSRGGRQQVGKSLSHAIVTMQTNRMNNRQVIMHCIPFIHCAVGGEGGGYRRWGVVQAMLYELEYLSKGLAEGVPSSLYALFVA